MKLHKALFAKIPMVCVLLVLALPALAARQTGWVLEKSTLIYHVVHPLHHVEGVSHAAHGKALCSDGECSFLIAVPVKSFASGDTNRDLHMLQITRGAEFPMVVVRTEVPEAALKSSTIHANLEIQFAGHMAHFKQVPFHLTTHGNQLRVKGTIPTTLTDFKIPAPELLFVPIKNQIPVSVNMIWRKVK